MADYKITLSADNRISDVLKQVQSDVSKLSSDASRLDAFQEKFNQVTNSTKPLKSQLRQIQQMIAQMNFDGLDKTALFTQMAQKAGEMKDAIGDASQAVTNFSSDTAKLDAMIAGLQGMAGAASIATGIMGTLGVENEKVNNAILKVQSALAILNGIQAIANTLNKDSALMLRIKAIMAKQEAASMAKSTVANGANTAAVIANTVAQKAWNIAKAVGKALLGDWTGLVLVGATALAAYGLATSENTEKQKSHNKEIERSKTIENTYMNSLKTSCGELIGNYRRLQLEWKTLSTNQQKTQWIRANKSELDRLNITYKSLSDVENAFVNNTDNVVNSLMKRAKAQAAAQAMVELYKKQIENTLKIEEANKQSEKRVKGTNSKVKAGDVVPNYNKVESSADKTGLKSGVDTRTTRSGGTLVTVLTEQGAKKFNDTNVYSTGSQTKEYQKQNAEIARQIGELSKIFRDNYTPEKATASNTGGSGGNNDNYARGSLKDLEKQLSALEDRLKNGLIPEDKVEATKNKIEKLKNDIERKKVSLGFSKEEIKPVEGSITDLTDKISTLEKKLSDGLIPKESIDETKSNIEKMKKEVEDKKIMLGLNTDKVKEQLNDLKKQAENIKMKPEQSSFQKAYSGGVSKPQSIDEYRSQIESNMDYNDQLMQQLNELAESYRKLGDAGAESLKQIEDKIESVNAEQGKLSEEAEKIGNFDRQKKKMDDFQENAVGMASIASGAFSSLGRIFSETSDKSAAMAMEIAGATADMVAQIVPQIMKLIGLKQAQAIAEGTAVAAGSSPFPANLIAISTIVTAVISAFATAIAAANKYATGGIVKGSSYFGDNILARVNAGEMILNQRQQSNLFNILNGSRANNGISVEQIDFRIKGADLYGALQNYNRIKSKVR